MFRKKKKVKLILSDFEQRLLVNAMIQWRNKLLQENKPTEDVNELLLKIIN